MKLLRIIFLSFKNEMKLSTAEIRVLLLALDNRLEVLDQRKNPDNPAMDGTLESAKGPVLDLIAKLTGFQYEAT